jgi:hypothetical protein
MSSNNHHIQMLLCCAMNWFCIKSNTYSVTCGSNHFHYVEFKLSIFTFYLYNLGRGVAKASKVTDSVK